MIKTFRGILADGGQDRISLKTRKGKVGYRIIKFQIIQVEPGQQAVESTVKIYKQKQSTIDNTVNFTDPNLLACAIWQKSDNSAYALTEAVIFDGQIVNQDIYITHEESDNSYPCNYYIEMEAIHLDDKSAEYTTIKDLRGYTQMNPWR